MHEYLSGEIDEADVLRRRLAAQEALIAEQARELAHFRKIFARASEAAQIGVWECELADNSLRWTDVVYDIFDLPRGSMPTREASLALYTPESRAEMERRRSRAIAERSSFTFDAEIVTAKGVQKFMRITAQVECEAGVPVRIFGMKQDITAEKRAIDRLRYLAAFDEMTGLPNRAQFQEKLSEMAEAGALSALLLVDLDGFKQVNDDHGHLAGDACLRETAARLSGACASADLVARVGGDEFAVLVGAGANLETIAELARAITAAMAEPFVLDGRSHALGASVGIALGAGVPPSDLFVNADTALYAAKSAGRGTFRIFKGEAAPQRDSRAA
ncbi:diguanylate cyclase domain-containing protein [Aliihoeflea sp. 40Bstr573]|uniref:diguanylate cyclase domain-containing protein n=1 Tax=Aliihoeflea sp. 40Bstr573 TaxID=2696467 RepID=UPI0020950AC2|nr:diguanylate cyclase [Aliihoeflea sp. 40Bstr573]